VSSPKTTGTGKPKTTTRQIFFDFAPLCQRHDSLGPPCATHLFVIEEDVTEALEASSRLEEQRRCHYNDDAALAGKIV